MGTVAPMVNLPARRGECQLGCEQGQREHVPNAGNCPDGLPEGRGECQLGCKQGQREHVPGGGSCPIGILEFFLTLKF